MLSISKYSRKTLPTMVNACDIKQNWIVIKWKLSLNKYCSRTFQMKEYRIHLKTFVANFVSFIYKLSMKTN
jgi:hypothetical protein